MLMEVEGRKGCRKRVAMVAWWDRDDTWITLETFASLLC